MQAVGLYIKTCREMQGMTMLEVATAAGTSPTQVWRIESGQHERAALAIVMAIVDAVKGRGDDILKLLTMNDPTDDYVRALARQAQLTDDEKAIVLQLFGSDRESRILMETIADLISDPALRARLRGYIDSLSGSSADGRGETPRRASRRRRSG